MRRNNVETLHRIFLWCAKFILVFNRKCVGQSSSPRVAHYQKVDGRIRECQFQLSQRKKDPRSHQGNYRRYDASQEFMNNSNDNFWKHWYPSDVCSALSSFLESRGITASGTNTEEKATGMPVSLLPHSVVLVIKNWINIIGQIVLTSRRVWM